MNFGNDTMKKDEIAVELRKAGSKKDWKKQNKLLAQLKRRREDARAATSEPAIMVTT